MKRTFIMIVAALLVFAAGCAKKPSGQIAAPTAGASDKAEVSASDSGSEAGDENAVVFENGGVTGAFNWEYFMAKASAGIAGSVNIVLSENGAKKTWALEYTGSAYKLTGEGTEAEFARMITSTMGSGADAKLVSVLTSEPELTVEEFAAGFDKLPPIGEPTPRGTLVYCAPAGK